MQELTEEEVIQQYQNIVFHHAHRMKGTYEFEDLVGEGYIGLLLAFRSYNEDAGAFATIAHRYVRGKMLKLMRKPKSGPHVPHDILLLARKIKRLDLLDKHPEEIAERINEQLGHVEKALIAINIEMTEFDANRFNATNVDETSYIGVRDFLELLTQRERFILQRIDAGSKQPAIAKELGTYQMKISRELKVIKDKYTKWSEQE